MNCPFSADRLREIYWAEKRSEAQIAALVNEWAEEDGDSADASEESVLSWLIAADISPRTEPDRVPHVSWMDLARVLRGGGQPRRKETSPGASGRGPRPIGAMRSDCIDLTGTRVGALLVQGIAYRGHKSLAYWRCLCDCGNLTNVRGQHLRLGRVKSCGCRRTPKRDLTDRSFGRLTVLGRTAGRANWWDCRCECGGLKSAAAENLRRGSTRSCGCLRRENSERRAAAWRKFVCPFSPAQLREMYLGLRWGPSRIAAEAARIGGDAPNRFTAWFWVKQAGILTRPLFGGKRRQARVGRKKPCRYVQPWPNE